jgi:circadian clock protein KaiC
LNQWIKENKMTDKLVIKRLSTGIPGLDTILGGGLPEFSFNVIAGSPGSGKTTLANQLMFSLAKPDYKAIYFTVLGEPAIKMLRYQQQNKFFDLNKLDTCIKFVNLSTETLDGDFEEVFERIRSEVQEFDPRLVFVDSFRSIVRATTKGSEEYMVQDFTQRLGLEMTSWQATTFLLGEYPPPELESSPIFTVADGILWMNQVATNNSVIRKIQVFKMRGQGPQLGLHTYSIDDDGVRIYPRAFRTVQELIWEKIANGEPSKRLSMGVPQLDKMMGGGLPRQYSILFVGPFGAGKTTLATKFLAEGVKNDEPGIVVTFERNASILLNKELGGLLQSKNVTLLDRRALDLSLDELLYDLEQLIRKTKAKRLVIDSLSGFEVALAPEFRENYRESVHRMVSQVNSLGVTVVLTSELEDRYTDLRFSHYGHAFLVDSIVMLRYVEIDSELTRVIAVIKLRGSDHSKEICRFEIKGGEVVIGKPLTGYEGLLSGQPTKVR